MKRWGLPVAAIAALAGLGHSALELHRGGREAENARLDLERSQELVRRIVDLERRSAQPRPEAMGLGDLTQRVEAAAKEAGIEAEKILRIEPEAPKRIAQGLFEEKPTRVSLSRVELPSLVRFLVLVEERVDGLRVKDLRIRSPHGELTGNSWMADLTLSYLLEARAADGSARRG